MSEYKTALKSAMENLAKDPAVCFVGYGVKYGGKAAGSLANVNPEQLIETPVAENLMVGLAIGLSLAGRRPVVYIERMDFILNAMDAIVNHLDKIETMSRGQFKPAVILRVVVGNKKKPLYTGETHTQDFTEAMRKLVTFPVIKLEHAAQVEPCYRSARNAMEAGQSTMLVELKDEI